MNNDYFNKLYPNQTGQRGESASKLNTARRI